MTTLAKICGVTRPDDAAVAANLGAAFLGLNFWPGSPRVIDLRRAKALARAARTAGPGIRLVGVFVDQPVDEMLAIADAVGLDVIQLHGDESPAVGAAVAATGRAVWKAIAIARADDLAAIAAWPGADAYLLDAAGPARGGTGQPIDQTIAAAAVAAGHRVVLAGGLNAKNVATAIAAVRPWAVDVASGVERAPGDKDPLALHQFLDAARRSVSYLRR